MRGAFPRDSHALANGGLPFAGATCNFSGAVMPATFAPLSAADEPVGMTPKHPIGPPGVPKGPGRGRAYSPRERHLGRPGAQGIVPPASERPQDEGLFPSN